MPSQEKPEEFDETGEVLFEQLEDLVRLRVKHLKAGGDCGCDDCLRYCRVAPILMEPWDEKEVDMKRFKSKVKSKKAGG